MAQVRGDRPLEGARSLRHYFDIAGESGTRDLMAQETARYLRAKYPVTIRELEQRQTP